MDSDRDQSCVIATMERNGVQIAAPVVEEITAELIERQIDVLIIDPFVSCHQAGENDNSAIDAIAKKWGRVDRAVLVPGRTGSLFRQRIGQIAENRYSHWS